jgi:hypothetical protein
MASGPCQGKMSVSPRLESPRKGAFLYHAVVSVFVMARLIGLYSPAPQSGKTFAANVLTQYGYRSMSFAEPIKRMAAEFIMSFGYTKDQALRFVWADKEKEIAEIKTTARHILQTLGTEWGRKCISNEIWTECMMYRIASCLRDKDCSIVIDDVRFVNEAETIKGMGGEMWMIIRPSATNSTKHESEGGLDKWEHFDHVIINDGTIADMRKKVDECAKC